MSTKLNIFIEKKSNSRNILLFVIIILAILSLSRAVQQAQVFSFDFSVSTAKLVSEGINNYEYVLEGKHDRSENDKILYSQDGQYAHGFHVLLIPFTKISWENAKLIWSLINLFFAIIIPILLCKKFKFSTIETLLLTSVLLMSTPLRINIGYGQHTLFTYFFLILPIIYNSKLSYLLSGFSYFKYNIGYAFFLYLIVQKKISNILISLIPVFLGWLIYSYLTGTNPVISLFQPFLTTQYLHQEGHFPSSIFTIFKYINIDGFILVLLPIVINFYVIYLSSSIKNELYKFSIICMSILAFTPHQIHDYILLFPLLLYSFKNLNLKISKLNIIFIFYFFFVLRVISFFYGTQPWEFPYGIFGYFNNFLTVLFVFINLLNGKKYILKK